MTRLPGGSLTAGPGREILLWGALLATGDSWTSDFEVFEPQCPSVSSRTPGRDRGEDELSGEVLWPLRGQRAATVIALIIIMRPLMGPAFLLRHVLFFVATFSDVETGEPPPSAHTYPQFRSGTRVPKGSFLHARASPGAASSSRCLSVPKATSRESGEGVAPGRTAGPTPGLDEQAVFAQLGALLLPHSQGVAGSGWSPGCGEPREGALESVSPENPDKPTQTRDPEAELGQPRRNRESLTKGPFLLPPASETQSRQGFVWGHAMNQGGVQDSLSAWWDSGVA